ncbi:MAG: T9SS type A sorting domain-containing protein [Bacteroidetes bacterium]|nr:T9SS type A sorting domain-containing protein [Bacteroidota bacterium]
MKKFTMFVLCLISFGAYAQLVRIDLPETNAFNPFGNTAEIIQLNKKKSSLLKAQYDTVKVNDWYSMVNSIYELSGSVKFSRFTPVMHSDSTLRYFYYDSSKVKSGEVWMHGVGHTFDPIDAIWEDDGLAETRQFPKKSASLTIDSVYFTGYYGRSTDTTVVDTLYVSFTKNVNNLQWPTSKEKFGVPEYGTDNRIVSPDTMIKILLTSKDTSLKKTRGFAFPVNRKLITPEVLAVALDFRPGTVVNHGDSLQAFADTSETNAAKIFIKKKINWFIANVYTDQSGFNDKGGRNNGFVLPTFQKVLSSWYYDKASKPRYIPGNAYAKAMYPYFQFKVVGEFVTNGINENIKPVTTSEIYPNPINNSQATVTFNLVNNQNVTVEVSNIVGQKVMTIANGNFAAGNNKVDFSTNNLKAGIYLYTIKAGGYSTTQKFTVIQ